MVHFFDYFRALDEEAVAELMAAAGGGPLLRKGHPPVADVVETNWIDPPVVLGKVLRFALDAAWDVDPVGERHVWPDGADQDEEYEGPWVSTLSERARDTLAEIPDDRLPSLAHRWSRIEEWSHFSEYPEPEYMLSVLEKLVRLARRARMNGERLYCWSCL
ncbi:hypothetical protein [Dactylosporangium cerinum]